MIAGGKELFKDFKVVKDRPVYIQLKDYLKKMIMKRAFARGSKNSFNKGTK